LILVGQISQIMNSAPTRRVADTHWELIAESLRQELAGYGGLLRLFQVQQRALLERDTEAVLHQGASIETLARSLADCRRRREHLVSAFASQHGRPADSPLRSLLSLIDANARPLLEALMGEVNHLLLRVRRAGHHNQSLLTRAMKAQRETLQLLTPRVRAKKTGPVSTAPGSARQPATNLRAAG
jgi:hypothetical protein